jgi:hypothetical protein
LSKNAESDAGSTGYLLNEIFLFADEMSLCTFSKDAAKKGLELIGDSKRNEMMAKWKQYQIAQLKLFILIGLSS